MKSRTTKTFWRYHDQLPSEVRSLAVQAYVRWHNDPAHPSLHFKCVSTKHAAYSARIGLHYRAVGYRDTIDGEPTMTWFWIGSHADYDNLLSTM